MESITTLVSAGKAAHSCEQLCDRSHLDCDTCVEWLQRRKEPFSRCTIGCCMVLRLGMVYHFDTILGVCQYALGNAPSGFKCKVPIQIDLSSQTSPKLANIAMHRTSPYLTALVIICLANNFWGHQLALDVH